MLEISRPRFSRSSVFQHMMFPCSMKETHYNGNKFTKYIKMREFHQILFILVGDPKSSVQNLALAADVSSTGRLFNI
jgi:hypothetical protein